VTTIHSIIYARLSITKQAECNLPRRSPRLLIQLGANQLRQQAKHLPDGGLLQSTYQARMQGPNKRPIETGRSLL
jgi:hypothetical protein